jgi:hypothetical protein
LAIKLPLKPIGRLAFLVFSLAHQFSFLAALVLLSIARLCVAVVFWAVPGIALSRHAVKNTKKAVVLPK